MIRIPSQTKKHAVGSNSDLFGTIHYTKNINLDEEGYIKLAPRAISVASEDTDHPQGDTNFDLPLALGKYGESSGTTSVNVLSADKGYLLAISETALSATQDTDTNAVPTADSHGRWFHNLWVVTDTDDFFDATTLSSYTDKGNLTSGKKHPVEVFRNRNTICFGAGNTVVQYTESGGTFTSSTTLTIPADFEVIKMAYANNKMGVATRLEAAQTGQNQDAYFFVWNGTDTSAEAGVPTGSDRAIDVVAYKGTFVVLTRTGQLLLYTGGGFQVLASFPFYFEDRTWGRPFTTDTFTDIMTVEGDVIYINMNGFFNDKGDRYEQYTPTNPGGIWCYDPNIGLYQRYSPSISWGSVLTVTSANVNTSTNVLTKTAGTVPSTGSPIKYVSDKTSHIGGLETPKVYYCIKTGATTFKLAETKALADAGTEIDITSTGAANNYFLGVELYDYGQSMMDNVGATGLLGGHNVMYNHLLWGAELNDHESTSKFDHLCLTSSGFENRGYFVTPKIPSQEIKDTAQKVYVKYRTLKSGDSIVVKVKAKDIEGLPVSTPQGRISTVNQCAWTSTTTFTTTADIGAAMDAVNDNEECECEIIAGAGAGVLVKISSITENAGTYTVTVAEAVPGAAADRECDVLIENWKVLGTISSTDADGYKAFPIAQTAPWFKFKVELRGVDTTVEEIQLINSVQKPSA